MYRTVYLGFAFWLSVSMLSAQEPEIWFAPNDHLVRSWKGLDAKGAGDFLQLFKPDAPWAKSAQFTRVFETNDFLILSLSDAELKTLIQNLAARKLKLAVDIEPIPYDGTCGLGYEGFGSLENNRRVAERIKAAGGTWDIASMDEPFWDASIDTRINPSNMTGPSAIPCRWSADKVASKVAETIALIKTYFPKIVVGDMELLDSNTELPAQYAIWMDAFKRATGQPLAFIHLDPAWGLPQLESRMMQVAQYAQARSVAFGVMYNGLNAYSVAATNQEWIHRAKRNSENFELQTGHTPDHAVFISWERFPDHLLPETDLTSHTSIIVNYIRPRTAISVSTESNPPTGALRLRSENGDGDAVGGATVETSWIARDGPGLLKEEVRTGTVPAFADFAIVGFRINDECGGCAASVDLRLRNMSYSENGGPNLVANPSFENGVANWGGGGTASAIVEVLDEAAGLKQLRVTASERETYLMNSSTVPVVPGAEYRFSWTSQIAPEAGSGGNFVVIFLSNKGQSARSSFPIETAVIAGEPLLTGEDGAFEIPVPEGLNPGKYMMSLRYPGTAELWPAVMNLDFQVDSSVPPERALQGRSTQSPK